MLIQFPHELFQNTESIFHLIAGLTFCILEYFCFQKIMHFMKSLDFWLLKVVIVSSIKQSITQHLTEMLKKV